MYIVIAIYTCIRNSEVYATGAKSYVLERRVMLMYH